MISIDASGWEGLEGLGQEVLRELKPRAETAMRKGLQEYENAIKNRLTGTRSGRTYCVSKTGRLHVASAPGEPPAVLTGHLRNSVGKTDPEWLGWELSATVGPGLGATKGSDEVRGYARRLEFGGGDSRGGYIAARPYMEPTAREMEGRITKIFEDSL